MVRFYPIFVADEIYITIIIKIRYLCVLRFVPAFEYSNGKPKPNVAYEHRIAITNVQPELASEIRLSPGRALRQRRTRREIDRATHSRDQKAIRVEQSSQLEVADREKLAWSWSRRLHVLELTRRRWWTNKC